MVTARWSIAPESTHLAARCTVSADSSRNVIAMITSIRQFTCWVAAHIDDERGASLVEYALLTALIALVCIAAVVTFGKNNANKLTANASSLA